MPRKNTVKRGGNGSITPVTNFIAKYGSDGYVQYPSAIFKDSEPDEKIFKPWNDPINNRIDNPDEDKALKYKSQMTLIKLDNDIYDICTQEEITNLEKIIEMINRSNGGNIKSENTFQEHARLQQIHGGYYWDSQAENINKDSFLAQLKIYKNQFNYACMDDPESRDVFLKPKDQLPHHIIEKYCYSDEDDIKIFIIKKLLNNTIKAIGFLYNKNFNYTLYDIINFFQRDFTYKISENDINILTILNQYGISIQEILELYTKHPKLLTDVVLQDTSKPGTFISNNFQEIIKYIELYSYRKYKCVYINCNPYYNYFDCRVEEKCPEHILKVEYNCNLYNEDIVSAYEDWILTGGELSKVNHGDIQLTNEYKTYILTRQEYSNNEAINLFIQQQCEYLRTLTIEQRRIIQDYTKIDTAFEFYQMYKKHDMENFQSFRDFSDSFYSQIHKIYPNLFDHYYRQHHKIPDSEYSFYHWLNNPRFIGKGEEYIVGKKECRSIFADITLIKWEVILEQFINDITELILNAPKVEKEIQGYRGVSGHYIHQTDEQAIEEERLRAERNSSSDPGLRKLVDDMSLFTSERLGSITFDFDISKGFYKKFYTKNSCMYRTTITKNCKVLLIAPLSVFRHEFEILTPPDSVFSYVKSIANDITIPATSNNIHKQFGILINQEFKTYDNILIKTPKEFEKYIERKTIIDIYKFTGSSANKKAEYILQFVNIFRKLLKNRRSNIYIDRIDASDKADIIEGLKQKEQKEEEYASLEAAQPITHKTNPLDSQATIDRYKKFLEKKESRQSRQSSIHMSSTAPPTYVSAPPLSNQDTMQRFELMQRNITI